MSDQPPPPWAPYPPPPPWAAYPPPPPAPVPRAAEGFPRYGDYHNKRVDEPSKAMAIWALVLACIPSAITLIVGIILAIVVLTTPQDQHDRGRGLAIAALVIAPLWIVAIILYIVLGVLQDPGPTSSGSGSGAVSVIAR